MGGSPMFLFREDMGEPPMPQLHFSFVKISELFYSIQGEGKLVGVPSVFVRQWMQSALRVVRYAVCELES